MDRLYSEVIKRFHFNKISDEGACIAGRCARFESLSDNPSAVLLEIISSGRLGKYFRWLAMELLQGGASVYYKNKFGSTVTKNIKDCPGFMVDDLILFTASLIQIQSARVHPRLQGPGYSVTLGKLPKDLWLKVREMIERHTDLV
jgi:hypothetical protein